MTNDNDQRLEPQNGDENSANQPDFELNGNRANPEPPSRFEGQNANPYSNQNEFGAQNGSQRPVSQTPPNNVNVSGVLLTMQEAQTFNSGRSFLTASQIMAIVSLFIGGVLLSTAAVIVAVMGKRKIDGVLQGKNADPMIRTTLDRASKVAIIMSVLALVLNAVSVILLYPMVMQAMQTGDYSSIFPFIAETPSTTSTGGSLFG